MGCNASSTTDLKNQLLSQGANANADGCSCISIEDCRVHIVCLTGESQTASTSAKIPACERITVVFFDDLSGVIDHGKSLWLLSRWGATPEMKIRMVYLVDGSYRS